MTLSETLESIEKEFSEHHGYLWSGSENDSLYKDVLSFLRSALMRVHAETAEAMEVKERLTDMKEHELSNTVRGYAPFDWNMHNQQFNAAIAAARSGLEAYRGGMSV